MQGGSWFMEAYKQSIKSLIETCEQEIGERGYEYYRQKRIRGYWKEFSDWAGRNGFEILTPEVCHKYCIETFGSVILPDVKNHDRLKFRAFRMLVSYQSDGYFEFRAPLLALQVLQGETGELMESYLADALNVRSQSKNTIENKRRYLYAFNTYLSKSGIRLENVITQTLNDFCVDRGYSLASKHNFNLTIRQFLRYAYDVGATASDMSFIVMPDNYKSHNKLPTTYEEGEICKMLQSVERGSAIGKRDYLVLLLASEYGWRSSDIVNFNFSHIDWDKNVIAIDQQKTGAALQ
jgi:integrase